MSRQKKKFFRGRKPIEGFFPLFFPTSVNASREKEGERGAATMQTTEVGNTQLRGRKKTLLGKQPFSLGHLSHHARRKSQKVLLQYATSVTPFSPFLVFMQRILWGLVAFFSCIRRRKWVLSFSLHQFSQGPLIGAKKYSGSTRREEKMHCAIKNSRWKKERE